MPANRMNRDEFYTAMAQNDDARLRKILWTLYWRGNAQLRERIEDELRSAEQPKVKPKKELPDPDTVLDEVTTFVQLGRLAISAGQRPAQQARVRQKSGTRDTAQGQHKAEHLVCQGAPSRREGAPWTLGPGPANERLTRSANRRHASGVNRSAGP